MTIVPVAYLRLCVAYLPEFRARPLDRRNAWWCEFNQGLVVIDKVAAPVTEGGDGG